MKISLNWLKDYLDFGRGKKTLEPHQLAEKLTHAGFEVESIKSLGGKLTGVVTGLVKTREKHPNADKLSICEVDLGEGGLKRIVCGAANVRAGLKVAVATEGTTLPNGMTIKAAKIRGEFSQGMICSESELGIAEESSGIMELPESIQIGVPLEEALPELSDTVLEVNITPNRPDCLGHLGLAREVAALFELKLKEPERVIRRLWSGSGLKVKIDDREGCPEYLGRNIRDLKILPSPAWVQGRLRALGLRPINQVVDATNYVLMEYGQPTHAFDARFLEGEQIRVRAAGEKQTFRTLDGKDRALLASDLLICDAKKPVALAGVMGGENSEIRDDTTEIILECAYFNPKRIRVTSRRLGITTDSSYRFERGVDPAVLEAVIDRLASLIFAWTEEQGGKAPRVFNVVAHKHKWPALKRIALDLGLVNQRLGLEKPLTPTHVKEILEPLGILAVKEKTKGSKKKRAVKSKEPEVILHFEIPTYRSDLERPIDLIEEIARYFGYVNIPSRLPALNLRSVTPQAVLLAKESLHEVLAGYGFHETIHYSFVPADEMKRLGIPLPNEKFPKALALQNPLAEDQNVMRTMLLPSLLRTATYNQHRGIPEIRLYELNKIFWNGAQGSTITPVERWHLGGVMAGKRVGETWSQETMDADFFDLKGVLEALFERLFTQKLTLEFISLEGVTGNSGPSAAEQYPFLHPGKSALLRWANLEKGAKAGEIIGWVGEIHPESALAFDFKGPIFGFEIDFNAILGLLKVKPALQFRQIPLYPAIRRDMALVVDEILPAEAVYHLISSMNKDIIEKIHLFDVYRGQQIPEGKKSLAYALYYLSRERTLTHEEVDRLHDALVKQLNSELGAQIRA